MVNKIYMFSEKIINLIMEENYECLDELEELDHKKIFDIDEAVLKYSDVLLNQIICDQSNYNFRSAFRKAILLKGLLNRKS